MNWSVLSSGTVTLTIVSASFCATAGCAHHTAPTSAALAVPSAPHDAQLAGETDETRARQNAKPAAVTRPLHPNGGRSPASQESGQPTSSMGHITRDLAPRATGGSMVVTTTPRQPGARTDVPASPAEPGKGGERSPRHIPLAVGVAGALIAAIKLLPQWLKRA